MNQTASAEISTRHNELDKNISANQRNKEQLRKPNVIYDQECDPLKVAAIQSMES